MNPSCQQLTDSIQTLSEMKREFDVAFDNSSRDVQDLVEIHTKIKTKSKEILYQIWPLEILTLENLQSQYDGQVKAYAETGFIDRLPDGQLGFTDAEGETQIFPTFEEVYDYLRKDEELIELMKTKEKQGFIRLNIAPFAMDLRTMVSKIESVVKNQGGADSSFISDSWENTDLNRQLEYFTSRDSNDTIISGVTKENLLKNSAFKSQLLSGCLISFCENNENLAKSDEDAEGIGGRIPIKCGHVYNDYLYILSRYQYQGESSFIPEEWFSLFIQKIYELYISQNKRLARHSDSRIFDTDTFSIFVQNQLPRGYLPMVNWYRHDPQLNLDADNPNASRGDIGMRTSVRKRFEISPILFS